MLNTITTPIVLYMELSDRANLGFGDPALDKYSNNEIAARALELRDAERDGGAIEKIRPR